MGERGRCRRGLDVGEREGDLGCGADALAVVGVVAGRVVVMLSLREKLGWWWWLACGCWWCVSRRSCWSRLAVVVV